jgi:hypothetical protein
MSTTHIHLYIYTTTTKNKNRKYITEVVCLFMNLGLEKQIIQNLLDMVHLNNPTIYFLKLFKLVINMSLLSQAFCE